MPPAPGTTTPSCAIPWRKPADCKTERYELLKRYVNAAPGPEWWNLVYSRGPLKLNEGDCNSAGPVSLDFVGGSTGWAEGSYEERERIFQAHVNYQQGHLYFLANDLPPEVRLGIKRRNVRRCRRYAVKTAPTHMHS